jgi:hypothetical protein
VRRFLSLPAVVVLLATGCSGGGDASSRGSSASIPSRLDCGSGVAGSERALRQFFAILRTGNEGEIRSVLADPGRFAWLTVGSKDARGQHWFVNVRHDPGEAARAVAQRGGLPLRIVRFTNSEAPHRTTDLGFTGRWNGTRPLVGKAAIDCKPGKARVLSVAVKRDIPRGDG